MSEEYFKKLSNYFIASVVIFVLAHLLWEHLNGGVLSHHLLHSSDLPAISNWWNIVVLPLLAWFSTTRIKRRISFQPDDPSAKGKIPKGILIGFFGMLLVSIFQSVTFEFGYENITMYTALCVLLVGLFLPIYRAECILGHVLGATFIFGSIIPIMGILVIATISAFSNLLMKPVLINIWGRFKKLRPQQSRK
ncbi:hypothetical protein [Gracilimonas halophila]|uniref:Uncharacterized protein n=1 Tax=Gracilimonas halophila TaxID=1834464 RepID=A0ABW5JNL3_9BACT